MKTAAIQVACLLALSSAAHATEFHVARRGDDTNSGTQGSPFRTIQHAADLAQPGDVITVHEGIYRERINPPRGGESDAERIVYQAAPGEKVEIRGSEVVKNWVRVQGDVWKASLPKTFFGHFNPYSDLIHGDWFEPKGRPHHTGVCTSTATGSPRRPVRMRFSSRFPKLRSGLPKWTRTTRPSGRSSRASIRMNRWWKSTFAGRCFIPISRAGITSRCAALRTARRHAVGSADRRTGGTGRHALEQGLDHREQHHQPFDVLGHCVGKYGDEWDNKSANSAEGYVKTIERALKTAGTRTRSATTSFATTPSRTASRRALSVAWESCSAW